MNHLFEKFHFIYFNWFLKYPVTGDLPAVIVHQPYSFRQIEILTTKPALRVTLGGKWLQEDIPPSPGLNTQMRCLSPMFPQFHFTNESKKSPVPLHSPIICFQGQKKKKNLSLVWKRFHHQRKHDGADCTWFSAFPEADAFKIFF